jgi:hypothetical protein
MSTIKLLVPSSAIPHACHTVRAANVVLFELLSALAAEPGIELLFVPVHFGHVSELTVKEIEGLRALVRAGVSLLPPLLLPAPPVGGRIRMRDIVFASTDLFYPVVKCRSGLVKLFRNANPDAILTVWSEPLTVLFADVPLPKMAYYGNPDPKSKRARLKFARRHGGSAWAYLRGILAAATLERAHLREMCKWQAVPNVAANDADYYRRQGHANAFYLQNVWIDRGLGRPSGVHPTVGGPIRIAASVGQLGGTANTFGFEYLLDQLLPELRRTFDGLPFELHVFGFGEPNPAVAALFDAPEVFRRGFVDDIDGELVACSSFLCVNNATEYNVGHTRYLHAWSLRCCVVAHANVRFAMPELKHGQNALLGSSAGEIAEHLLTVASDSLLRETIAEGGHATFLSYFTAKPVASKLASHLRQLVSKTAD